MVAFIISRNGGLVLAVTSSHWDQCRSTIENLQSDEVGVKHRKTPVLTAGEARALLDSIDGTLIGLRDRALIGRRQAAETD
jgi:hypothetical protein